MKFFALETDTDALKKRFLTEGEEEVTTVYYHGLSFAFAMIRQTLFTVIIAAIAIGAFISGVPPWGLLVTTFLVWFFFVFLNAFTAYVDWYYDFVIITTDKVVLVNQSSIFKQNIKPINLDNFASVSTDTQFFDIFDFGSVSLHLKEGTGADITLKYIPRAEEVTAILADCVTKYQRRNIQRA